MRVAVLRGGWSLERAVSLRSGARVEAALRSLGHEPVALDPDRELTARLEEGRFDAAFVAVHGQGGEDGTLQGLLETLRLPYTGSGPAAASLAFAKPLAKRLWRRAGLPTPAFFSVTQEAVRELGLLDALPAVLADIGLPLVAKPARGGSALGIRMARTPDDVAAALLGAFAYDGEALLERLVEGRDVAVSVIERGGRPEPLPVVEARPRDREFYDFEARYTPGLTLFDAPADLPAPLAAQARELAVAAYEALGCSGAARVDLMLGEDGLQLLELNVVPGLTETSLLPLAATAAGLDLDEVVAIALDGARLHAADRS
jgi:D-alanine-D-alanine ligase